LVVGLSALLFGVGTYGVLARRNVIAMLMAVELMLAAASLDLVGFDAWLKDVTHQGQIAVLFIVVIAAAEVGVGFAIVLNVFRLRETVAVDELTDLAESSAGDPDRDDVDAAEHAAVGTDGA
jgi:NADH-quinone oxidoreductase subunit K